MTNDQLLELSPAQFNQAFRAKQLALSMLPQPQKVIGLPPRGYWISGPTGTGKSTAVQLIARALGLPIHLQNPGESWYDGIPEKCILQLEDANPQHASALRVSLKLLGDAGPLRLPVKGAHAWTDPVAVIVTSNYTMKDILKFAPFDLPACQRKFREETLGTRDEQEQLVADIIQRIDPVKYEEIYLQ